MRPVFLAFLLCAAPVRADTAALVAELDADAALTRFLAAEALGKTGAAGRAALPALIARLDDSEAFVRLAAGRAIVLLRPDKQHLPALVKRLGHRDEEAAQLVAEVCAGIGAPAVDPLVKALGDESPRVRRTTALALYLLGRTAVPAIPALLDRALDEDRTVQRAAARALRRIGPWSLEYLPELLDAARFGNPERRWLAMRVIEKLGPAAKEAVPALKAIVNGDDPDRLKESAAAALKAVDVKLPKPRHPALKDPAQARATAPAKFRVAFETTKGDFVVEVERAWAPVGADRFFNLVRIGFFDDAAFFRVLKGFVAQFGLHADSRVSGVWKDATIAADPRSQKNARGTLVYAQTDQPDSRTTQLFFNLQANPGLDKQGFSPIGRVVKGLDVLDALHSGYGDGYPRGQGPDQRSIVSMGNVYLKRSFPRLDYIRSARIVEED
ncbi:MAG: HEAT repeat domain-containing protein [Planctomycetota bacterium]|nr:HEAT repeat domain-containing protein [Planctomycetota bacterium]